MEEERHPERNFAYKTLPDRFGDVKMVAFDVAGEFRSSRVAYGDVTLDYILTSSCFDNCFTQKR